MTLGLQRASKRPATLEVLAAVFLCLAHSEIGTNLRSYTNPRRGYRIFWMALETDEKPLIVSTDLGFVPYPTEGVSSKVFTRGDRIYKLNNRNSLQRQRSDLLRLKQITADYSDHLPQTSIVPAIMDGAQYSCVIQPRIESKELKKLGREGVLRLLNGNPHNNRLFIHTLLGAFFSSIQRRELYPDIVGYPQDPDFFNAVNLLAEDRSGKIMLCDVGLSPHEDTLRKFGPDFYQSENVETYVRKMQDFSDILYETYLNDSDEIQHSLERDPNHYKVVVVNDMDIVGEASQGRIEFAAAVNMRTGEIFMGADHASMSVSQGIPYSAYCAAVACLYSKDRKVMLLRNEVWDFRTGQLAHNATRDAIQKRLQMTFYGFDQ